MSELDIVRQVNADTKMADHFEPKMADLWKCRQAPVQGRLHHGSLESIECFKDSHSTNKAHFETN